MLTLAPLTLFRSIDHKGQVGNSSTCRHATLTVSHFAYPYNHGCPLTLTKNPTRNTEHFLLD